jgi:hypothetical protein
MSVGLAFYVLLPRVGGVGAAVPIETCSDWTKASDRDKRITTADLLSARLRDVDGISTAPSNNQVDLFLSALDEWCEAPPQDLVADHGDVALQIATIADVRYEAHRDALTEGGGKPEPWPSAAPSV